jgi:hypothetical protein
MILAAIEPNLSARILVMILNWKLARAIGLKLSSLSAPGVHIWHQIIVHEKVLCGIHHIRTYDVPESLIEMSRVSIRAWCCIPTEIKNSTLNFIC